MEYWLNARGYIVVAPEHVTIENYVVPNNLASLKPTSLDSNIPHILEKLFANTMSVRVMSKTVTKDIVTNVTATKKRIVSKTETKQFFVFVRDLTNKKFCKKDLVELSTRFIPLADCILFTTGVTKTLIQIYFRKAVECGRMVEMLPLKDLLFDKLRHRYIGDYLVLNEAEIVQEETLRKKKRTQFPRLLTSDAIVRYLGLRPSTVVKVFKPTSSFKIVVPGGCVAIK